MVGFYFALAVLVASILAIALSAGADREPERSLAGDYRVSAGQDCLGSELELRQSGQYAALHSPDGDHLGRIRIRDGELDGSVECRTGASGELSAEAEADGEAETITGTIGDAPVVARRQMVPVDEFSLEGVSEAERRELGELLTSFFLALIVVMAGARLVGGLAVRLHQPRVMGEVVAGILLGPSLFGFLLPEVQAEVFPAEILPTLGVVASLGLIFYMFLIGVDIDLTRLRARASQITAVAISGIALPLALGVAVAGPVFEMLAPETDFVAFALFLGVAMSITAFPVLARILDERGMLNSPVGTTVMAAAAIDDVLAWLLVALATAIAVAGSTGEVLGTIALALAFCLFMFMVARPGIRRLSAVYAGAGTAPSAGWLTVIFAGVLLSAYVTEKIGIALIFGAFVAGLIMPRGQALTRAVTSRIEDFVVIVLLPVFFAYTGLRTDVGLLDRADLWLLTAGLIAVAITAKLVGTMLAARLSGFDWRAAGVIGTLMNTRGLTELILLNLALEIGVISETLFTALVLMALVTTFMAGPVLRLLDPRNTLAGRGRDGAAGPEPAGP